MAVHPDEQEFAQDEHPEDLAVPVQSAVQDDAQDEHPEDLAVPLHSPLQVDRHDDEQVIQSEAFDEPLHSPLQLTVHDEAQEEQPESPPPEEFSLFIQVAVHVVQLGDTGSHDESISGAIIQVKNGSTPEVHFLKKIRLLMISFLSISMQMIIEYEPIFHGPALLQKCSNDDYMMSSDQKNCYWNCYEQHKDRTTHPMMMSIK